MVGNTVTNCGGRRLNVRAESDDVCGMEMQSTGAKRLRPASLDKNLPDEDLNT